MAATLFYLDSLPEPGDVAVLDGAEGHHAATVRRIGVGATLVLADGRGEVAEATVTAARPGRLELAVLERWTAPPPTPPVTVVQALPKSDRSELAVELATEAGADAIVPWRAARCVARWQGAKADKGVAKWRATARAAARQSRRSRIPAIPDLHSTADVVAFVAAAAVRGVLVAVLHESARARFTDLRFADAREVVLVVGPEGGLDEHELATLSAAGAVPVLLGPTVLRTSTAAAVALGALGALTPRWSAAKLDVAGLPETESRP
ncbi:MAG TPA: 16S rRNA (uracil(1498)-N(3))-methyltransferase [Aldersonia sp.]